LGQHFRRSDVGINYQPLQQLLAQEKWEAAAAETKYLIFQITAKTQHPPIGQDWVTTAGVAQFPCRDLATMNELWVNASHNHYGFSTQAKLWGKSFDPKSLKQDPKRWARYRPSNPPPTSTIGPCAPMTKSNLPEPHGSTALNNVGYIR
jgi:hypothetical protein